MRPRRLTFVLASSIAAVTGALTACGWVIGLHDYETVRADAAPAPGPIDPCTHRTPPPPPEIDDDPTGEVPPFFLVARTFTVAGDGGTDTGFDLDGVCTCEKGHGTSHEGASSCVPISDDCDAVGGVDNQATRLLGVFATDDTSPDKLLAQDTAIGRRAVLFYVSKYNGKKNDKDISVGMLISNGIRDGRGCGTELNALGFAAPGWCGHDRWSYPQSFIKPTKDPTTKEPETMLQGWVTNGVMVFHSTYPVPILFGNAQVLLSSAIGTAVVEKNAAGRWTSRGMLGGRVPVEGFLASVGSFADKGSGVGVCTLPIFTTAKTVICGSADIAQTSRQDFEGKACDALSMGMSFETEEIELGDAHDEAPLTTDCAPENVDAGLYKCPTL